MGNISKAIGVVKFSLFFMLMCVILIEFQMVEHEHIHQSINEAFNVTSYIKYDINGGYVYYDHSQCPKGSDCYRAQMAVEQTKPELDRMLIRFMFGGWLIIMATEISYWLILRKRLTKMNVFR